MKQQSDEKSDSISDLSKEFDIATRSIRLYKDQELLTPATGAKPEFIAKATESD